MRILTLLLLTGCPGPEPTDDTSDSGGLDTASCVDGDGDLGDPTAPACAAAGGVCVADVDQCAGGTRLSDHDAECAFDDGAGFCCMPPAPASSGGTCGDSGGVCAPIAGCGFVHGWITPNGDECTSTWGVGNVCCAPGDACEGWGVSTCCTNDGATAFTPSCDRGEVVCTIEGTARVCDQDCPALGG